MKIRASIPDETTYLALFFAGLNFFNSIKNYENEFNLGFYYIIFASFLFGSIVAIFFMRFHGWILPENTNEREE